MGVEIFLLSNYQKIFNAAKMWCAKYWSLTHCYTNEFDKNVQTGTIFERFSQKLPTEKLSHLCLNLLSDSFYFFNTDIQKLKKHEDLHEKQKISYSQNTSNYSEVAWCLSLFLKEAYGINSVPQVHRRGLFFESEQDLTALEKLIRQIFRKSAKYFWVSPQKNYVKFATQQANITIK